MPRSTEVQLAVRAERTKRKTAELAGEIKNKTRQVSELKRDIKDLEEDISDLESGKNGGILQAILGLVGFGAGFTIGWAVQRSIEGTEWSDTAKAPMGIPITSMIAFLPAMGTIFLPNRFARVGAPAFFGGMTAGPVLGHQMGPWPEN